MDALSQMINQQPKPRYCPNCNNRLSYSSTHGEFYCKNCDYKELDLYGQMLSLLENDPTLSKVEISMILGVPMRQINFFIDDGKLYNPYMDTI